MRHVFSAAACLFLAGCSASPMGSPINDGFWGPRASAPPKYRPAVVADREIRYPDQSKIREARASAVTKLDVPHGEPEDRFAWDIKNDAELARKLNICRRC